MEGRATPSQYSNLYCINCNMCINYLPKYPVCQLNARVISVISSWIHTQINNEEDYICEGCRDLAILDVNKTLQQTASGSGDQQPGPSRQGQVCLLCGCSVIRRQSSLILQNYTSHHHKAMVEIVQNRIAPRQILRSDRVCYPCWLRTQREAQRVKRVDSGRSHQDKVDEPAENLSKSPNPETEQCLPENLSLLQKIDLPSYRTAADINHDKCVFPSCNNTTLNNIADGLRISVLKYHKYYLPIQVRVCTEHMLSNSWELLFGSVNSTQNFTVSQIEHVFSLVNALF